MVEDMLAEAGIPSAQVTSVTPLDGGTFNDVSRVTLSDGRRLILKVAPPPDVPILTYERGILRTEALFYELAASHQGLPAVVHAGFGHPDGAGDFLLMTEVPGQPWPAVADRIDDGQRQRLRGDLGRIVAGLHAMTGSEFGYPSWPLSASWRTAFGGMLDTILTEADQYDIALPLPTRVIRQLAAKHQSVLDEVTTPVLVHFDLWDGNILIDTGAETPRIGGVIDAERAFWGDPLADFVSLALGGDIQRDEAFLAGYREAGGPARLDASSPVRLALYRTYLYLIMLVESAPRHYDEAKLERLERSVPPVLAAELGLLMRSEPRKARLGRARRVLAAGQSPALATEKQTESARRAG
jgi:aminoglycoside phosphotransferase (APT) family kinase protein